MKWKIIKRTCLLMAALSVLAGCAPVKEGPPETAPQIPAGEQIPGTGAGPLQYEVDPETFSLTVERNGQSLPVSLPTERRTATNLIKSGSGTSWEYPEEQISVSVQSKEDYLHVTIRADSESDQEFQWPSVSGSAYYMPFGEGKRIPAADSHWGLYLDGAEFTVLEQLSMPFWATEYGGCAVLFIMENPYRNYMRFTASPGIQFTLTHQYPGIDPKRENSFRIYVTENDPAKAAKIYRRFVMEQGNFVTLEQKAQQNPDIRKLYGAPHIYLWGDNIVEPEDISWPEFRAALNSEIMNHARQLAPQTESGPEALTALLDMSRQDYASQYQKDLICRFLTELIKTDGFYKPEIFPLQNDRMKELLQKGNGNLNGSEAIQLNKHALAVNLPEVFRPADTWMDDSTVNLLRNLESSGIEQAWIGLNSWEQAYAKPELAETAKALGYLVGPYDSYHSIHQPEKEQWITAAFPDHSLYENATISKKNGEKVSGFQNVGRKLNPALSLPSVRERVGEILSARIPFNSWFIDCDATGEIYDDYTASHITTQQEDLNARLERMAYIRDQHGMVIGSEGGNDFAAPVIAFAHGIELKSFSWMDEDMKSNQDSEYYIGRYYNPSGKVAERFTKRVPVKEQYYKIFVDPRYDLPLFKLVYNDSVITSYHWDWSTFKIKGAVQDRMLREILYNTPPLYHLDTEQWETCQNDIQAHTKVWSQFHRRAVVQEMTGFQYLEADGSVQFAQYGDKLSAAANFSDSPYSYMGMEIPGHSILINADGKMSVYTPRPENR